MNPARTVCLSAIVTAVLFATPLPVRANPASDLSEPAPDHPKPGFGGWGFDPADIDRSVRPGDDFFAYVNGKWDRAEVIPPQYPYSGVTLALRLDAQRKVRAIAEQLAASPHPAGSDEQRIADTWRAFLDRQAIDAAGLEPARPFLDRIHAATTRGALAMLMAEPGFPSPMVFAIDSDPRHPTANVAFVRIASLGLLDRDTYLVDTVRNETIRARYRAYLAFLLTRAGYADGVGTADKVYEFEHRIAILDWDRTTARDPRLVTNPIGRADFVAWGGAFPLGPLLTATGLGSVDSLIVEEVPPSPERIAGLGLSAETLAKLGDGFPALARLLGEEDIATIQAWMAAQFLNANAAVLPADIDAANFDFYGRTLQGREADRERWLRANDTVEAALGDAVGQIYVRRYFPASSRAATLALVANLRASLASDLRTLAWMSPETRTAARAKLDAMTARIGYPDKFRTYDGMAVRPDAPLANAIEAQRWHWQNELRGLADGVDKTRWRMTPQTVNAWYSRTANEVVLPAAILQPPLFNPHADDAVNYGAIGAIIGHEIGHGFDDRGSRYDASGAPKDWWPPADRRSFDAMAARLVEQYDRQCPLDDGKTCHNGRLTLGENIGDLNGLTIAWQAYHLSLHGKPAKMIDGLTGDQRFFLAYAQTWRNKFREDFARQLIATDTHALDMARVNGVLRNFDPWYKAFAVKPGDRLWLSPAERIRIW